VAAAATGLADPVALIDARRREPLRRLREVRRLAQASGQVKSRGEPWPT